MTDTIQEKLRLTAKKWVVLGKKDGRQGKSNQYPANHWYAIGYMDGVLERKGLPPYEDK